jgi:hypothetical protein
MPPTKSPIFLYLPLFLLISLPQAGAQIRETKKPSFSSVLISDSRIKALKKRVRGKIEPTYHAFEACRIHADRNLNRTPTAPKKWHVPGYYRDAEGHKKAKNGLRDDANAAYSLALCFRITGEKKYAQSAVRLINAWATHIETMSGKDDSTLSFSYHFPALIFAADLIRDEKVWPKEQQKAFSEFLRNKALPMSTMNRQNNWGNWGLVLSSSCAVYLKDEALFKKCVDRWKYFIEHQVAADGHLPHEVTRSGGQRGIWYSHFSLMPQTIAAEILTVDGTDLYDFKSPNGRTLKQAYEKIAEWTCKPDSFPYWKGDPKKLKSVHYFSYFEILNTHWPNNDASELLSKSRPMTAKHSAPFLTFTHGNTFKKTK